MRSDIRPQFVPVSLQEVAAGAACCKTVVVVAEAARNTCLYRTLGELEMDDTQAQAEGGL